MPNFIPIRPAVWISIENRHTHKHTDIALYVLDNLEMIVSLSPNPWSSLVEGDGLTQQYGMIQ